MQFDKPNLCVSFKGYPIILKKTKKIETLDDAEREKEREICKNRKRFDLQMIQ